MLELIAYFLILTGIILIFAGMISRVEYPEDVHEPFEESRYEDFEIEEKKIERRKVKGAGIVMIGPIPIIFGDSKYALYLAILAIFLMLFGFLFMISI
jgi:uncharacterized protein (TIGR00304 family)